LIRKRARIATDFQEIYGFCLGRMGADVVAVASDKDGDIGVWRLGVAQDGAVTSARIANFSLGSITEGCVVDDAHGVYYLGDELRGVWRVDLSDSNGANKRQIDAVGQGRLVADVEGVALWTREDGGGYLIVSVQGRSRYAVYDRVTNAYLGAFRIAGSADGSADAVSGTDGVDVTSAPLPGYPRGLFVAQDDENSAPRDLQNFKYLSWADVEAALGLDAPR
jgi:3-phytase